MARGTGHVSGPYSVRWDAAYQDRDEFLERLDNDDFDLSATPAEIRRIEREAAKNERVRFATGSYSGD